MSLPDRALFFFNDTATTEIYTLSLHDAFPICYPCIERAGIVWAYMGPKAKQPGPPGVEWANLPETHVFVSKRLQECNYLQARSDEHTSELQSRQYLVCRLLLEKPKLTRFSLQS